LVEIERAWKNEIYEGSIPVGPGGMTTSIGATDPTLAAVGTLLDSIIGLTSKTGASEKNQTNFIFAQTTEHIQLWESAP